MAGRFASIRVVTAVLALIFISAVFGGNKNSTPKETNTDICWGVTTSNCKTSQEVKPSNCKTFRSEKSTEPIVGVFATRYDLKDDVWGKGVIKGTKLAKKQCYDSAMVFWSVVYGTTAEPLTIDLTFGSSAREVCSYGYNVKVCFKVNKK